MVMNAPALELVGTVLHKQGRSIASGKLEKTAEWPNPCPNITSLRVFPGICGYVRPFIQDFAKLDAPLRRLLEKRTEYEWGRDAQQSVELLKRAALRVSTLSKIDYESRNEIVLAVDSSYVAPGFALYQRDDHRVEFARVAKRTCDAMVGLHQAVRFRYEACHGGTTSIAGRTITAGRAPAYRKSF